MFLNYCHYFVALLQLFCYNNVCHIVFLYLFVQSSFVLLAFTLLVAPRKIISLMINNILSYLFLNGEQLHQG